MTKLLIRLFTKKGDIKEAAVRRSFGNLSGAVGIICNALLCCIKLVAGIASGAMSLVADGLNNLSDMGSSVVTLIGFRAAAKPADRDHPYGHGRIEYISALVVAVFILTVGIELLKSSVKAIASGTAAAVISPAAAAALAVSVAVKLWMFFFNRRLAGIIGSEALSAVARDSISDTLSTAAILASFGISSAFNIPFNLDAVMALLVSLFILRTGLVTAKDTISELLGKPPSPELIEEIRRLALSFDSFLGIHDLIIHSYGPGRCFASMHIEVPQSVDIVRCHEQIDLCERLIRERTGVETVIHMDPIDNGPEAARVRLELAAKLRAVDERLSMHDFRMTPCGEQQTNLIFDVVLPADFSGDCAQLKSDIAAAARSLNPTYCCVITLDRDYNGC